MFFKIYNLDKNDFEIQLYSFKKYTKKKLYKNSRFRMPLKQVPNNISS